MLSKEFLFPFDGVCLVDGKFEYLIRGFVSFVKNLSFLYLSVKMLVWVDEEMGRFSEFR